MNFLRMLAAAAFIIVLSTMRDRASFGAATPTRIHVSQVTTGKRALNAVTATSAWSARTRATILGRMIQQRVGRAEGIGKASIKIPVVTSLPVLDPTQNPNFDPLL